MALHVAAISLLVGALDAWLAEVAPQLAPLLDAVLNEVLPKILETLERIASTLADQLGGLPLYVTLLFVLGLWVFLPVTLTIPPSRTVISIFL